MFFVLFNYNRQVALRIVDAILITAATCFHSLSTGLPAHQAIIDTVLLGSMGFGGLSGVGRSNHVDNAEIYFKKWVHAKYGIHVEFVKKGGCTLIRNVRYLNYGTCIAKWRQPIAGAFLFPAASQARNIYCIGLAVSHRN